VLIAVAAPFVASAIVIHPMQGVFRDWDVFAAAGVTLSFAAAWAIAGFLARRPSLAVAVALTAACGAASWLLHHADPVRGRERVERFVTAAPHRTAPERARVFEFLGMVDNAASRWESAASCFERAAVEGPSVTILTGWAKAEMLAGRPERARDACRRLVADHPRLPVGWEGLMASSYRLGDLGEARRAARELVRLDPAHPDAGWLLSSQGTTR
jgi:tetratricopeptide (TPR) repeat protein